jgi:hypothetical protein
MRPPRDRTRRSGVWVALAVGVALVVLIVLAISLSGGHHRSSGDYAAFAACPLRDPQTDLCLFTQTTGGEFVVGSKTVPLSRTIILQGGVHVVENQEKEIVKDEFIAAAGGETMSKTSQAVPGGLRGVVDPGLLGSAQRNLFDELLARGSTEVTATIELAAPASSIGVSTQNLIEARGIGLSLPLKVRLSNPFLGGSCYIGSDAHPIVVALTTGRTARTGRTASTDTARPPPLHGLLAGKPGHAEFKDHYNLVTLREDALVSDSFAAPRATGCGAAIDSSRVDSAVDAGLGLPAAAARNTAILDVTLQDANAPAVLG